MVGVGALVGSFVARAVLRFFWHRLAGAATGIVIGPAAAAASSPAGSRPTPRHGCAWSATSPPRRGGAPSAGLPRLGSIADISRVAREHDVERVIVTEQEMSEPRAEQLIEECKGAGLA